MKANITISTARELYKQGGAGKAFALDNFTEKELTSKDLPETWEELKVIKGYYINNNNETTKSYTLKCDHLSKDVFRTEEQALAAIALAQLSQLMYVYNDGWEPNYEEVTQTMYVIYFRGNKIFRNVFMSARSFLVFKTSEIRDQFLTNFRDLIEQAKPLL